MTTEYNLPDATSGITQTEITGAEITGQTEITEAEANQAIATIGRHWGVLLSFGVLAAGLGIAMMVWPQATIAVVAILLGLSLLVSGVFSLVSGFTAPDQQTSTRVLSVITGVLSIVLGLVAFRGIAQATAILAIVVGIGWVLRGIVDVVNGIAAKGVPGRGLVITIGVLSLIAGLVVLLWPQITLTALAWIGGLWMLLLGIVQIVAAFTLRSAGKKAASALV